MFLTLSILLPPARLSAEENLLKPLGEAFAAWTGGRPDDAIGSLEYVIFRSSDTVLTLAAIKEISVLLSEQGKNREALAYLARAEILAPEDPYIAFEKGWNLLSLENHLDARASFEKALTLTGETDISNQARFGLALAEAHLGGPAAATESIQTVYSKYPYLLSPAAQLISAQYEKLKNRQHAITFLNEALNYDPRNIQAEIDLARLYEKSDYYLPAWQAYYTLSELDPEDGYFSGKAAGLASHIAGKLENLLYWTRMSWPVHVKPVDYSDKNLVRVGLFSDNGGSPTLLTEFSFIANSAFTITDSRLGAVGGGKASMQWNVRYDPMSKIYEIRDSMGSVVHSTRNSFRLTPKVKGGVILIKSPVITADKGVNRGDREVAGELNIIVRDNGFRVVNSVALESLVPSIVTSLASGNKQLQALKALAVVVRSNLMRLKSGSARNDPDYDFCDSQHCLPFPGLQVENEAALSAAGQTRGEILTKNGVPVDVHFHSACGGFTAEGIDDNGRAQTRMTPFNLYYTTLKAPRDDLFCLAEDRTQSSDVLWTLMLRTKWIENRVNRIARIGYIRSMTVLKRSPGGRVLSLRIDGTAGGTTLEGFDAVSRALAGGLLRSPLFTLRPVSEGKYPGYFLLRGIGTGDGHGYCILGGRGMAKDLGSAYTAILRHYFPDHKILKIP